MLCSVVFIHPPLIHYLFLYSLHKDLTPDSSLMIWWRFIPTTLLRIPTASILTPCEISVSKAHWDKMHVKICYHTDQLIFFPFRRAVCQHCAFPQRDQPVQSGGAAGSKMETVQQRGDSSLPEQSMPAWFLFPLFYYSHFLLNVCDIIQTVSKQTIPFHMASDYWSVWWITKKTESQLLSLFFPSPSPFDHLCETRGR